LFWLGVGLVAAAGVLAALLGPWWVAAADAVIVLALVAAQRHAERVLREAEHELCADDASERRQVSDEGEQFYVVALPYATFGIIARDGHVVDAAPIARWMIGKPIEHVRTHVVSKGGRIDTTLAAAEGWPTSLPEG
jgi:hypothetical protein